MQGHGPDSKNRSQAKYEYGKTKDELTEITAKRIREIDGLLWSTPTEKRNGRPDFYVFGEGPSIALWIKGDVSRTKMTQPQQNFSEALSNQGFRCLVICTTEDLDDALSRFSSRGT